MPIGKEDVVKTIQKDGKTYKVIEVVEQKKEKFYEIQPDDTIQSKLGWYKIETDIQENLYGYVFHGQGGYGDDGSHALTSYSITDNPTLENLKNNRFSTSGLSWSRHEVDKKLSCLGNLINYFDGYTYLRAKIHDDLENHRINYSLELIIEVDMQGNPIK